MQVIHPRCCGLDVHKKTIVACVLLTAADGTVEKHWRSFSTLTVGLLTLVDWLDAWQISHVAMESTGVYWRAAFSVLEADHTVLLVNAQHMKAVPGHKTDVKDAEWLADLLRHGLLKASFIPPAPVRHLRELTRYRKSLVQERAEVLNRLHKVLETANSKLASVASDVLGKSGRDMLEALIRGTTDVEVLAELARGTLRQKIPQLQTALEGRLLPPHRLLLGQILAHIDFLEGSLAHLQRAIEEYLRPFEEALDLIRSVPGIQATAAATILAEIGTDMSRFLSAKHLACLRWPLSGQQAEWRQTAQWEDNQRQSLLARGAGGSGLGDRSYEAELPFSAVPPTRPAARQEASRGGVNAEIKAHPSFW